MSRVLLLVLCFVVLCIEQESTRSCTEYVDNVLSAFAMLYLVGNGIRHRFSLYMAAFDTCTRGAYDKGVYGDVGICVTMRSVCECQFAVSVCAA